jgi:hypothetical protein
MLQWNDYPLSNSYTLDLPICHVSIDPFRKRHGDAPIDGIVSSYRIAVLNGEYETEDIPPFAEKVVAAADVDTLKRQALDFVREKIQETLALIGED